jgi:hypothetical protein
MARGDVQTAQKALSLVEGPLQAQALADLAHLHRMKKEFDQAFAVERARLLSTEVAEREKRLESLSELVLEGKLWNRGIELPTLGHRVGATGALEARLEFLAGRSYFELDRCPQAIQSYQNGLKEGAQLSASAEARYRLGKCFARVNRSEQARQVWQELSMLQDSFWSPLARSEMKFLK